MELALDGAPTPPARGKILQVPSNQKYNKGLKVMADVAGIQKPLTSHVGRHTFGALMIAGGVSVVSLMEMMGLTKIDTAMIYIHSSLEQQAREIKRAQEGFLLGS
jgi:site-specific recombinase XerD